MRKSDSRPSRISHEVAGLAWLADCAPGAAAVVPVLESGRTWLVEPRLERAAPTPRAAEDFGRALARTHAAGADNLGAPPPGHEGDGWMGEAPLSLPTDPAPSWGAFYAEHRIAPYLDCPGFTLSQRATLARLCSRLASGGFDHDQPDLVRRAIGEGGDEDGSGSKRLIGAARTHGDLWSGNLMWTPNGAVLIDPAAQGGHAEEDLAALTVFGCPYVERIHAAYAEASPLADGWRERIGLHSLHILVVHVYLFGASYASDVMMAAKRYA